MTDTKFTYFMDGQASFMRAGLDALSDELNPVLDSTGWQNAPDLLDTNTVLRIDTRPTMDAGTISGLVVGLVFFVGAWAGKKALDEFYELKLREPLFKFLTKTIQKGNFPDSKHLEYQQLVNFEDKNLAVLIRLMIKSESEIKQSIDLLLQVHKSANQWIIEHGKKAPIHCYVVEDGNCNLEPMLYNSLSEIKEEERQKVIRKIMGKQKS